MKRLIVDTNIFLLDANNLLLLGSKDVTIVVGETVLEELDSKKSGLQEINYQARQVSRLLAKAEIVEIDKSDDKATTTVLKIEDTTIEVVALNKYDIDTASDSRNDQKIQAVAKHMSDKYGNVTVMSNDVMMRLRCMADGLAVTELKVVEDAEFEFVKEQLIDDPEMFRTLHNANILDVDPAYKLEHYSYKFTCANTNQMKLATINNGFISVLGKDTERELRRQECPPIGAEQLLASKAIMDPTVDLVVIEGKAGSGKNIVTLSSMMKLMKTTKDKYTSIVYIRNPVDDVGNPDEEIGFLSTNDGKEAVYLGPMEDTLQFIVRNKIKRSKQETIPEYESRITEATEKMRAEYGMESIISLGLRGRTFSNALVILDEFQNAGASTTQKVLTRIGKDCKVVMTGSMNQIDSKYLTKYNNGLSLLMNEASKREIDSDINMFAITLEKVQRSGMCDFAEKLFSK